jgi:hypothetical protein
VRREVNHALNEWLRERRQRRQACSATQTVTRAWGEDTPSEPESLEEDEEDQEEEGEVILPPPPAPLHEALPMLRDIFRRHSRIAVGACWQKLTRIETRLSTSSPP